MYQACNPIPPMRADVIFFHLPALDNEVDTMFGVACYRQVAAKDVANKTADVTRSVMQKSVVVISRQVCGGDRWA